jgi:hypothetical protein
MPETPEIGRQVHGVASADRPWQFSLRSLLVLTAICAALLSVMTTFPFVGYVLGGVLLILGIALLTATVTTAACIGANFLMDATWGVVKRIARAAPDKEDGL